MMAIVLLLSMIALFGLAFDTVSASEADLSHQADAEYPSLAYAASEVREQIAGKKFRNNPELNHQLRLVLQFMGEFLPTSEDYAERLQNIIMEVWSTEGYENAGN